MTKLEKLKEELYFATQHLKNLSSDLNELIREEERDILNKSALANVNVLDTKPKDQVFKKQDYMIIDGKKVEGPVWVPNEAFSTGKIPYIKEEELKNL